MKAIDSNYKPKFFINQLSNETANQRKNIQYHYTSPNGLLSIIKNKSLRFTDIRFLNDKSESLYLVKVICDYFAENKQKYSIIEEAFNRLIGANDISKLQKLKISNIEYKVPSSYHKRRHFVFCMCDNCDELNMWNYYVNNGSYQGYNIGFNINSLMHTFYTDNKNPILHKNFSVNYGKVLYDKKSQFSEIDNKFQELEIRYKFNYQIEALSTELLNYIDSFCAFFKHPKFEGEKESRIVIETPDNYLHSPNFDFPQLTNNLMRYDFYTKNGLIIPCLYVKINSDSFSRITVSPIMEAEITQNSIRELVSTEGIKGCSVYQSKIPIRF